MVLFVTFLKSLNQVKNILPFSKYASSHKLVSIVPFALIFDLHLYCASSEARRFCPKMLSKYFS